MRRYFESDRPGHRVGRTRLEDCDSDIDYLESDLDYLSQHYLEYYSVIKLLLSYGFKPHLSNWKQCVFILFPCSVQVTNSQSAYTN